MAGKMQKLILKSSEWIFSLYIIVDLFIIEYVHMKSL